MCVWKGFCRLLVRFDVRAPVSPTTRKRTRKAPETIFRTSQAPEKFGPVESHNILPRKVAEVHMLPKTFSGNLFPIKIVAARTQFF